MPDTTKPVSEMTNGDLDRAGAVEVMGWRIRECTSLELTDIGRVPDGQPYYLMPGDVPDEAAWCYQVGDPEFPSPSTNPTDDYTILVHVMENWSICEQRHFRRALSLLALQRITAKNDSLKSFVYCHTDDLLFHLTGDYTKAAVQTARGSADACNRP